MVLDKLDVHMQMNETGPLPSSYTKINLKWFKDLNVRPETIRLLDNGSMLLDTGLVNDILNLIPKAKATKIKNKQGDSIKMKSFCTAKEIINKMKRQLMK